MKIESLAKKNIPTINSFVNLKKCDPVDKIMELTNDVGANLIFTANPIVKTHEMALEIVSKRGVVNFFGGLPKSSKAIKVLSNAIHYKESCITGSHGCTPEQHKKALALITEKVDLSSLITHRFPLNKILDAFETAKSGEGLKVIVKPNV